MMKVKRDTLLLLACLVWSAAGFNVLRLGLMAYPAHRGIWNYLRSALVFTVFQLFVFGRLVTKHTERISAYTEEMQFFLKFFDGKSFAVMAFMISGGIWLRASGVAPERFIAVFYTGLGASLLLAGILFGASFGRAVAAAQNDKTMIENEKGAMTMKRYLNTSLVYAILAMVGGVFYREFTKFNGFTGKTTLAVVHTHYFLLGMLFFLLLLLLEKSFAFTTAKTGKAILTYQVGLNITAVMMVVRGVAQVLGTEFSKGANAAISGIAGIGHILLGVSMVLVLLQLKRSVPESR